MAKGKLVRDVFEGHVLLWHLNAGKVKTIPCNTIKGLGLPKRHALNRILIQTVFDRHLKNIVGKDGIALVPIKLYLLCFVYILLFNFVFLARHVLSEC